MAATTLQLRVLAMTAAGALLLAACGGGSDADNELISAMEASMNEEGEELPAGFTEEDGTCIIGALVSAVGGAEGAEEKYGVTAANVGTFDDFDLTQGDAESFVDKLTDCVDLKDMLVDEVASENMTRSQAECMLEGVSLDSLKQLMVAEFSDVDTAEAEAEIEASMTEAAPDCLGG